MARTQQKEPPRRGPRERAGGRAPGELRPVTVTRKYTRHAAGSVLIEAGETKVICTAAVDDGVPPFLRDSGRGWLTAEYAMLPSSTPERKRREERHGKIEGRTQEIQRLIGRSLRAIVDFPKIAERTIWVDCDVIQADGGTRTAAITGAYIALVDAMLHLKRQKLLADGWPLRASVQATSVGIVDGEPRLDLEYEEDVRAEVDMNVVMTGDGRFIEVQGTGERRSFDGDELRSLLELARMGNARLAAFQADAIGEVPAHGER